MVDIETPAPPTEPPTADAKSTTARPVVGAAPKTPRIWATPLLVGLNLVGFAIETWLGCSPTNPTVPQLRAAGAAVARIRQHADARTSARGFADRAVARPPFARPASARGRAAARGAGVFRLGVARGADVLGRRDILHAVAIHCHIGPGVRRPRRVMRTSTGFVASRPPLCPPSLTVVQSARASRVASSPVAPSGPPAPPSAAGEKSTTPGPPCSPPTCPLQGRRPRPHLIALVAIRTHPLIPVPVR